MKDYALPHTAAVIDRVRRLRMQRKVSAKELAERMTTLGYLTSRTAIAQAEAGCRREISVDWVHAAAEALKVPAELLFRGPNCDVCSDLPPDGFACNTCGKGWD